MTDYEQPLLISLPADEADFDAIDRKYRFSSVIKRDWHVLPPGFDFKPVSELAKLLDELRQRRGRLLAQPGFRLWSVDGR